MFPLPPTQTHETGLSSETRILELWDTPVLVVSGICIDVVVSSLPHHGPRELILVSGCTTPDTSQSGRMGKGMGRGRG